MRGHSWSLGYQKRPNARTWVVRWRDPTGGYRYDTLGTSDDVSGGITFDEALELARKRVERFENGDGSNGVLTVKKALAEYVEDLEGGDRDAATAESHINAFIEPAWGDREVASLRRDELRHWKNRLAKKPPRKRTSTFSKKVEHRDVDMTDKETKRRRRASVNRLLTTFKAALNLALENHPGQVSNGDEWRIGLKPLPRTHAPRTAWINADQVDRLLNACPTDFRQLCAAALFTGTRYGELARIEVRHFDARNRSIYVEHSKSGRARTVHLNASAVDFFERVAAGKGACDLLLSKIDGSAWGKGHQARRMQLACEAAGLPVMGFHQLRHSYASIAAENGLPLQVLANNLGHADTRMVERHYAHLADKYVRKEIAKRTAAFTVEFDGVQVVSIRR